jgi:metal-dependent HD superfamily phosphatase/phosphodiesterase
VVTAAAFHDLGFTLHYYDHESASIAIARQILPGMGFLKSSCAPSMT